MRKLRDILCGVLLAVALLPVVASAHQAEPVHTVNISAGVYQLQIGFSNWPLRASVPAQAVVSAISSRDADLKLDIEAELVPGKNVASGAVKQKVNRSAGDNGIAYNIVVEPPAEGDWSLAVSVRSAAGSGQGDVPLSVDAPPAFPLWLGWIIGLSPLLGLVAFAISEYRAVRHRPALPLSA